MSIRVAIVGVGNCAKSLVEGVSHYTQRKDVAGLAFPIIGGYKPTDIKFVLGYDIDRRKVGKNISEAIYERPNCAKPLINWVPWAECEGSIVKMGQILDGVAPHMEGVDGFLVKYEGDQPTVDEVADDLRSHNVDVVLLYLPVGSEEATKFYVNCCLQARVPFVNCIPVFIVSNPDWKDRIEEAGIPAIGDDMRSQVGASILSQVLQEMFLDRGARVQFHCQTNQGGNTDFQNMLDRKRLVSKKKSKENVITSQNELRGIPYKRDSMHAGPSDYVPYLGDNKVAHIRIEAEGFCGAPITLDCRLSVQDSPNSAGIVIDAIRFLKTAHDIGMKGPLLGPSAFTQKTPPKQLTYAEAYEACKKLAAWDPDGVLGKSQSAGNRPVAGM